MMQLIEWLQIQLKENQFLVAAMGGGVFYTALSYLRTVVSYITRFLTYLFSREITMRQNEDCYITFLAFIGANVKQPRNTRLALHKSGMYQVIGRGVHRFFYKWSYISVVISEETKAGVDRPIESISVTVWSWNPEKSKTNILANFSHKEQEEIKGYKYKSIFGCFDPIPTKINRSIDSVFTTKEISNRIKNLIKNYLETEKYTKFNIPKKLGIMLYGPPGTGKTSMIKAIATEMNRSIYYFPSQASQVLGAISDIATCKPGTIIAIEDIDCICSAIGKREDDDEIPKDVQLGTILSFLDGQDLPDDMVIIATTNYLDKIDPAIIRPGRFDLLLEMPKADMEIAKEMVNSLYPERISLLQELEFPVSQAEIQAKLLM
jgi:hypothetical protein